ncbi:hypothetical protein [Streptomyces silvisoli]|uniref:Uncharacterized protein n=1 Tax=Streptomyces silvisoli TaxID=3034235 RepID=A0ABT5ZP35_9ACTN|nr:hypothetical protein [Streptomyces silvisoli]MDF3291562.1 hypothetical protein [Streptomyces silvisoli]
MGNADEARRGAVAAAARKGLQKLGQEAPLAVVALSVCQVLSQDVQVGTIRRTFHRQRSVQLTTVVMEMKAGLS